VISALDSGLDKHVWDAEIGGFPNMDVTGFSVDTAITIGAAGTAHGPFQASFGFPTTLGVPDARAALMGPNMKFSVVPVPNALVLMASGLWLTARVCRNAKARVTREAAISPLTT
jgi:hypothetical protein